MLGCRPGRRFLGLQLTRVSISPKPCVSIPGAARFAGYQPYDATFDPEELTEARSWYQSFRVANLPSGTTTFARSSGPGGQHVNKTESKATTTWTIAELSSAVPKLLRTQLRSSRYYSKRNDSISLQAQTQRSRTANAEENQHKLFEELQRLYKETIPGETNPGKKIKYEALEKRFHEKRVQAKKQHGSKKATRRGGNGE